MPISSSFFIIKLLNIFLKKLELRKSKKLTKEELAELIGILGQAINAIEK